MPQGQLLVFSVGLLLGVIITVISAEFFLHRRKKESANLQKQSQDRAIVRDTLKFFFHANDVLNDLWVDKEVWFKFHKEVPEKSFEFEQRMVRRFDDSTRNDFFNELMFHSFQLKTVGDASLSEEFDALMSTLKELSGRLLLAKTIEEYADLDKRYNEQKKNFLAKCAAFYK
jgi:hypothetical protein